MLSLPLNTTEGFILSRVDGVTSVDDISMMSGIAPERLTEILQRLAELGAVSLSWLEPSGSESKPSGRPGHEPPQQDEPPPYDPAELDAPGDLPRELKRRILDKYHKLEGRNLYEILGVGRGAERAEIRSAYFEQSKVFHPDSQFGKQLGDFEQKMVAVFKKLTEAYEVLGKKKKRREYDEYLGYTEETRDIHDKLDAAGAMADSIRQSEPPESQDAAPSPPPAQAERVQDPEAARAARAAGLRAPRNDDERRARARARLRRRLRTMSGAASRPPPSIPAAQTAVDRKAVLSDLHSSLRASAAATGGTAYTEVIKSHLEKARLSERNGDMLGAASALQLALAQAPHIEELQREQDRVSRLVAAQLADNYEKQARYEEKTGLWDSAAKSWARVVEGRPDSAEAARAAANALLKSAGDLRRAAELAERAVRISPDTVDNLTVLARVYLEAGLKLNAKRELVKAAKLDPDDEMVKNLLRDAG